jgi:hypothetical protein
MRRNPYAVVEGLAMASHAVGAVKAYIRIKEAFERETRDSWTRSGIHLIDVLLGGGRRLFDQLPHRLELEQTGLGQIDGVTHLGYGVVP